MMCPRRTPIVSLALCLAIPLTVTAQGQPTPPTPATLPIPPAPATPLTPPDAPAPAARARGGPRLSLDVQVVIVRQQGGTVISRLPYSLAVTTNVGEAVLNMGADVPVPSTTLTPGRPAPARPVTPALPGAGAAGPPVPPQPPQPPEAPGPPQPVQSVSYRSVGTVISCRATTTDDGLYELVLSVDDSTVLPRDASVSAATAPGLPAFRSFRARHTLLMRDGQTRTISVAADRASGEEVRVEVSLRAAR